MNKYWKFPGADWEVYRGTAYTGEVGDTTLRNPHTKGFIMIQAWSGGVPQAHDWGAGVPCDSAGNDLAPHPYNSKAEQSVWDTQVGGTHYTDMKIQPFQYSMANSLDPMQHTIIKYVSRFRAKNGVQDLEKAKQTIELLIEWEKQNATEA